MDMLVTRPISSVQQMQMVKAPSGAIDALVFDQANGSDTLFSREGVRITVYHRCLALSWSFRKETPKEPSLLGSHAP